MNDKKTILVSPLDWGLGHATRLIPIIRYYNECGYKVVIAGYGKSFELLKKEFPHLSFYKLAGFNVKYSGTGNHVIKMVLQLPSFFYWKWKEHRLLQQLIGKIKPQLIISDNRYGLFTAKIPTVIITHQLKLFLPSYLKPMEKLIQWRLKKWVEKFNYCWIPDNAGGLSLTTKMTQVDPLPHNIHFIGLLSRFNQNDATQNNGNCEYEVVAIVSGPEPQRTFFLNLLISQLSDLPYQSLIMSGNPFSEHMEVKNNLSIVGHVNAQLMHLYIEKSKVVICRSGYSSIMDLISLKKRAILVPTPHQPEQEMLAQKLSLMKAFYCVKQSELNLKVDIEAALNFDFDHLSLAFFPKGTSKPLLP